MKVIQARTEERARLLESLDSPLDKKVGTRSMPSSAESLPTFSGSAGSFNIHLRSFPIIDKGTDLISECELKVVFLHIQDVSYSPLTEKGSAEWQASALRGAEDIP